MSTREPGTRVWAVRSADQDTIYAYGFGTYVGDEVPPDMAEPDAGSVEMYKEWIRAEDEKPAGFRGRELAEWLLSQGQITPEAAAEAIAEDVASDEADRLRPMADRVRDTHRLLVKNPKIELEDGGVVWGRECWWGPAGESTAQRWAKGRRIVYVPAPHPPERDATVPAAAL